MYYFLSDNLAFLVTLSRYHSDFSSAAPGNRKADRFPAVYDNGIRNLLSLYLYHYITDYGKGRLLSRIIRSNYKKIRISAGCLAHFETAVSVSVPAAAENTRQPVRPISRKSCKKILQSRTVVGVIDDDQTAVFQRKHLLSTRNLHAAQRLFYPVRRYAKETADRRCCHPIVAGKFAWHRHDQINIIIPFDLKFHT